MGYDFEERAEGIRREMQNRREKLRRGESLIVFEQSTHAKRRAQKISEAKMRKKKKK